MTTLDTKNRRFLLACLLAVVHFGFLMAYFEPAISTPDANGYFAQARRIATSGRTDFETASPLQYIDPMWISSDQQRYFSKYPPGLPTLAAGLFALFGPNAALLINPLFASLTLIGLFLVCRLWIGSAWGVLAVALMAVNPTANQHALHNDAHTAVACFLVWGLYFLARWSKDRTPIWAIAAGLCAGIIPTVRYAEILFTFAFGLYILSHIHKNRTERRSLLAFILGAALPIGALLIRNQFAFGAFWRTGYAVTNEQTGFGWTFFIAHAVPYLQALLGQGAGLTFGLGVTGIAALCARPATRREGLLFAALIVPTTLLYMAYYWAPDPQSMRFLMPTFAIYIIASVWFLRILHGSLPGPARAAALVLLLITIAWGLPQSVQDMQQEKRQNDERVQIADTLNANTESGSLLLADRALLSYLDYLGRWDLADASFLENRPERPPFRRRNESATQPMRPPTPRTNPYSALTGAERFTAVAHDLQTWAGDRGKVYCLISESELETYRENLPASNHLTVLAHIDPPAANAHTSEVGPGGFPPGDFNRPARFSSGFGPPNRPPFPRGGPGNRFNVFPNDEPLVLVAWTFAS